MWTYPVCLFWARYAKMLKYHLVLPDPLLLLKQNLVEPQVMSGDIRAIQDREAAVWNSNLLKLIRCFFFDFWDKGSWNNNPKSGLRKRLVHAFEAQPHGIYIRARWWTPRTDVYSRSGFQHAKQHKCSSCCGQFWSKSVFNLTMDAGRHIHYPLRNFQMLQDVLLNLHLEMHLPCWHTYRPKNSTKLSKWWLTFDDFVFHSPFYQKEEVRTLTITLQLNEFNLSY